MGFRGRALCLRGPPALSSVLRRDAAALLLCSALLIDARVAVRVAIANETGFKSRPHCRELLDGEAENAGEFPPVRGERPVLEPAMREELHIDATLLVRHRADLEVGQVVRGVKLERGSLVGWLLGAKRSGVVNGGGHEIPWCLGCGFTACECDSAPSLPLSATLSPWVVPSPCPRESPGSAGSEFSLLTAPVRGVPR
jgi:hypothetical protein